MSRVTKCRCGAAATSCTTWRTPIMRASAFWYDCAACLPATVAALARDSNATFNVRPLQEVAT